MFEEEEENSFEKTKKMPLYVKAKEIFELSERITDLVFEYGETQGDDSFEKERIKDAAQHILENALIIPAKIQGAMVGCVYDLKMENATIIRKCAREISTNCMVFEMFNFKDVDYLDLLREEIEVFRVLFAEWVKTFDQWDYIIDRWGLFNPPGINYDDHDPDDDLPFNPSDFLGE